jgi:alkaline phosphatase
MKLKGVLLALLLCLPLALFADDNDTVAIKTFREYPDATAIAGVKKVKNIILLIGDGMGFNQVTAARMAAFGRGVGLAMDRMEETGQNITLSLDDELITDSAAGATALASGIKTLNGMIGENPDGKRVKTIADVARKLGKSTGVVASCDVTHATPACFASHVKNRSNAWEIARQMADEPLDVLLGGGYQYFLPGSHPQSTRDDELDLVARMRGRGATVVLDPEEFRALDTGKVKTLVGLLAAGHPKPAPERNVSLKEMTRAALDLLKRNPKGFFLMVEASQIDWEGHGNNFQGNVAETLDFDETIGMVLEFAEADGNTLVIVTADHETGGLSINKASEEKSSLTGGWTTGTHTANPVPIFAHGPNSQAFGRVLHNHQIPQLAVQGWGVKNFVDFAYGK